ncbi:MULTISPECIES: VOC family protein [unclassified Neisseria]|uniref:VOC family protein n=1 Tax=unclassified Neisseria TaxID=2623750 RepID=UPI0026671228|nr:MULTISPECIES: VOC family protein [unclassified Neisseria]MDO1508791.1 VOC family protein [Neisseria sp. MVDL19-042950]MDO1515050.1 VOC family protein [Neisseria sp. MVDL18-041461]MDO1562410.1 VOC family protein [Neisseria sp. MVDL20-010259]
MSTNPSILSHVSLGTNRFEEAVAFYDKVLASLGIGRILDISEHRAVAYGRAYPEFWIQAPYDGQPAQAANGVHVAFYAETSEEVDAFYQAALAAGAKDDGAPGTRPDYGKEYYGCFVRDLDGHKIEAMAWLAE